MNKIENTDYASHNSGMPDEAYARMVAKHTYAWEHRMEIDPLEGFEQRKQLREVGDFPHSVQDVLNGDGNHRLQNRSWMRTRKPEATG